MKIPTNRLYSLALGLAYLAAIPLQAGIDWPIISRYIKSRSFFVSYLYQKLTDSSVATEVKPFEMPNPLPSPETIANGIADYINPHLFLRGASTSEHQCSKLCTPEICSWSRFAQQHSLAQPTDSQYPINWWQHYRDYIDFAKNELHLNAIRFSIEWPLVQPRDGNSFDKSVLNHYAELFKYTIQQGMTPLICFHHYTDPCWFLDAGGFHEEKNIHYFVNYCTRTYEAIMSKVSQHRATRTALKNMYPREPLWATFNAPEGYAFRGYHQQQGPPALSEKSGLATVAQVLKNELEAHVQVYYALKASHKNLNLESHGIHAPMIGLLKNIHQLDADTSSLASYLLKPLTTCMCACADMIQNGALYNFFTTGEYRIHIPFVSDITHINPYAIGSLDFIGLNHYANRMMFLSQTMMPTEPSLCSDNPYYYRYPQGMYRAIVELSEKIARPLKIPLYVAENGIATSSDIKRHRFYHEYLYAIARAIHDGYPVYGYFPWTLASNYEWPTIGNTAHRDYGMCTVNPENPAQLIVKEGSRSYLAFTHQMLQHEIQPTLQNKTELITI